MVNCLIVSHSANKEFMLEKPPKINLIYIASTGRSGSTLLETILGAHSQVVTAGEIQIWPYDILEAGEIPCGCGTPVPQCSFWTKMRQRVNPLQQPKPQIHFFRESYNAGKTLRLKRLRQFWMATPPEDITTQVKVYGENNYQVFQAFLELMQAETGSGANWVVDSSKDPYRLLWLLQSNLFNIKVLHVVKDPRAFVYSMTKDVLKEKKQIIQKKLLDLTLMKSSSWVVQNYLISKMARNHIDSSDYRLIHYEKLASQPEEILKDVCQMIGCSFEEQMLTHFWDNTIHTIAGNPMRFRKGGIVLDEAWRRSLPPVYKKLTEVVTGTSMSRYQY